MIDTTPYDDARRAYTREALARLALSRAAADLAEGAGALVVTRNDADTGPGGRVSEARQLAEHAERLLARAVVYERERGASWEDIARYLDLEPRAAEERFAPELARWSEAFEVPYRLDETGRKRVPQLPDGAYDPDCARERLDLWASLHATIRDRHAVSAGLRMAHPAEQETYPETEPDEMSGWIWESRLRAFLELVSHYNGYVFDDIDWETVEIGLDPTDDDRSDAWYSYPLIGSVHSLDVRVARSVGAGIVSVVVTGAGSPDLRLRISTLFAAFCE